MRAALLFLLAVLGFIALVVVSAHCGAASNGCMWTI